jgi:transcriptional regulator with XRE-family HTH domain
MRRRRIEQGLSQADLAAAVGLDKRRIRRYEAGEAQPSLGRCPGHRSGAGDLP